MFGASSTLLNADHYDVYFKGMPFWNGKVNNFLLHWDTSIPSSSHGKVNNFPCFSKMQVLRRHGDVFERTSRGYYRAHGRADDTMNLGGIKVGTNFGNKTGLEFNVRLGICMNMKSNLVPVLGRWWF